MRSTFYGCILKHSLPIDDMQTGVDNASLAARRDYLPLLPASSWTHPTNVFQHFSCLRSCNADTCETNAEFSLCLLNEQLSRASFYTE